MTYSNALVPIVFSVFGKVIEVISLLAKPLLIYYESNYNLNPKEHLEHLNNVPSLMILESHHGHLLFSIA